MVFITHQIHNVIIDVDFHTTDWHVERFAQIRHSNRQYIELSLHPFTEHNVFVDNHKDGRNSNLNCQSMIVNFHFYHSIEHGKYRVNFNLFYYCLIEKEVHFHNNLVYVFVLDVHVINCVTNSHNDFRSGSSMLTTHIQYLVFSFRYVNEIQIRREWDSSCEMVVHNVDLQVEFAFSTTFHVCLSISQFNDVYKHE